MKNSKHYFKQPNKSAKERYFLKCLEMLKTKRNNKYICVFLTLTFSEKTLNNTNEKTRLRYVKKWLNNQAKTYILNRDYGKENEREHYHALIIPKGALLIYDSYIKIGFIKKRYFNLIKETYHNKEIKHLDHIAINLTNHAFKDSTKESKIIYSRLQPKHNRIKQTDNALIKERLKLIKNA